MPRDLHVCAAVSASIAARGTTDHTAEVKVMHLEENFLNYQRSSSNTKELMLLNCGVGEDS